MDSAVIETEIRKQLIGTPEQIDPHIMRVAREFQFQDFDYDAREERIISSKLCKYITIYRVTSWLDPDEFWATGGQGLPHEVLPHVIGGITLQSITNNKTLFLARSIPLSSDTKASYGFYFDAFLARLSSDMKNLGFEETTTKRAWRVFKEVLSIAKTVKT